jgi:hypothetical protein
MFCIWFEVFGLKFQVAEQTLNFCNEIKCSYCSGFVAVSSTGVFFQLYALEIGSDNVKCNPNPIIKVTKPISIFFQHLILY